ncbi:DNA methyltransferase [Lactococcus lactis]|uniref:DNA methyltransferase n=1 Tax=Lactococcus lactis TaxID=1358 RepID=UPI003F248668
MIYPIVSGKEKTIHSTQKPIALFNELILRHSNENEVVLDPFIGSGTTAVSSMSTHRNFIGFELNKEYFEIAQNRIKKAGNEIN